MVPTRIFRQSTIPQKQYLENSSKNHHPKSYFSKMGGSAISSKTGGMVFIRNRKLGEIGGKFCQNRSLSDPTFTTIKNLRVSENAG